MSKTLYKQIDLRKGTILKNREHGYRATVSGFQKDGDRVIINLDSGITHSFSKARLLHFFDPVEELDARFSPTPEQPCRKCGNDRQSIGAYCFKCAESVDFSNFSASATISNPVENQNPIPPPLSMDDKIVYIASALNPDLSEDERINLTRAAVFFRSNPKAHEESAERLAKIAQICLDPLARNKSTAKLLVRKLFPGTTYDNNLKMLFSMGGLPYKIPFDFGEKITREAPRKSRTKQTKASAEAQQPLKERLAALKREAAELEQRIKEEENAQLQDLARQLITVVEERRMVRGWSYVQHGSYDVLVRRKK